MSRTAIIITGMHRSGTSFVASILNKCGVEIGNDLLGSNESNPHGHFEDYEFLRFHEALLGEENKAGLIDSDPPRVGPAEMVKAQTLIQTREHNKLWGWKDPRTTLYLEFWREQLELSKFILVYRHPMEVVISLIRRGSDWNVLSDPLRLIRIWDFYNRRILDFTRKYPDQCLLCNISGITNDAEGFFKQVERNFGVNLKTREIADLYHPESLHQIARQKESDHFLQSVMPTSLVLYNELEKNADITDTNTNSRSIKLPWGNFENIADTTDANDNELVSSLIYLLSSVVNPEPIRRMSQFRNNLIARQQREIRSRDEAILRSHSELDTRNNSISQLQNEFDLLNQERVLLQMELRESNVELSETSRRLILREARQKLLVNSKFLRLMEKLHNYWRAGSATISMWRGNLQQPFLFDAEWYLKCWPHIAKLKIGKWKINPYIHYRLWGWREGRNPSQHFNVLWYLQQYPIALEAKDPLDHYLLAWRQGNNPNPCFDVSWYLQKNPDVQDANMEPLEHYLRAGWLEGRDPSPNFSNTNNLTNHPELLDQDLNSITRYLSHSHNDNATSRNRDQSVTNKTYVNRTFFSDESNIQNFSESYEDKISLDSKSAKVKMIAFYLPQFHPIPENDTFWGKGFTEWTNVTQARPLFNGHYQPRLPGELGFYDLRILDNMRQQSDMAKEYGIYGFCFHHYWFNGRRVLHRPVDQFLAQPDIDIKFCLCWANENWTRAWDGKNSEVLIEQTHRPEDDMKFIADALRFFRDPRYIKIENKPVLVIYNCLLLPDARGTVNRWRDFCKKEGFDDIFLVATETHGFDNPTAAGFDAVVEFPPLKVLPDPVTDSYQFYTDFKGEVYEYEDLVDIYTRHEAIDCVKFKTVSPDWDNTARRDSAATVFQGASPSKYQHWLTDAINITLDRNEQEHQIVFVNAWNEWAESAYLEPDRKYGYAYLNATVRALTGVEKETNKLLFLSHDAYRGGAQRVLLNLLYWLKEHTKFELYVVLGETGVLHREFQMSFPSLDLSSITDRSPNNLRREINRFCGNDVSLVLANTVVTEWIVPHVLGLNAPVVMYVHELQKSIEKFSDKERFANIINNIDYFLAASAPVKDNLIEIYKVPNDKIEIIHDFINTTKPIDNRITARRLLGLITDVVIVFGCGTLDWRKAPDLFVDVAQNLLRRGLTDFHFYWIGGGHIDYPDLITGLSDRGLDKYVTILGEKENPTEYLATGDIFLLSSREDPYPLVCLMAADCGLPIVCFEGAGGMPAFVDEAKGGFVVPYEDVPSMSNKVAVLIENQTLREQCGSNARNALNKSHTTDVSAPKILKIIRIVTRTKPRVSIIVPAYNHARFLHKRLDSIFQQTFRDFEVILLDDASTDETSAILKEYKRKFDNILDISEKNSGSTFAQWIKGIGKANSELIWIAEDDDFCERDFLEKLLPSFDDPAVKLVYCQSYAVDDADNVLFSYKDYTKDISNDRWDSHYKVSSDDEVNSSLGIKNTIPNASSVLFRRFDISEWESEWSTRELAGDWAFYLHAMRDGKIAFHPEHLNCHRRHNDTNIFRTQFKESRFSETVRVHKWTLEAYDVTDKTKSIMRDHAHETWRAVFPKKTESDFNTAYDVIIKAQ